MKVASKKAVLYLRVSTEEQVDNFSLGTQDELCKKEAERRHLEIDKIFREEGKSAKNIVGRPVLIKLLEYCRRNKNRIAAVIVYRLDRVSRSTADYLAVRKKLSDYGISIISATEPTGDGPTEKLIETILAGFAQLDNDIRSERAKNGMYARFKSGLTSSPAPFGYTKINGYVMKDEASFDKIRKAWELMATGTKSTKEMTEIMSKWGFKRVKDGKRFKMSYKFVLRIFRSKFYAGILSSSTYNEDVQGQHIPMITMEMYSKIQELLDKRNDSKFNIVKRNVNNEDFPLRRLVKCSKCRFSFTGSWSTGKAGGKFPYYYCGNCKGLKYTSRKILHEAFFQLLKKADAKQLELLSSLLTNCIYQYRQKRLQQRRRISDNQIFRLNGQKQSIIDKNLAGVYSDDVFKEQYGIVEEQLKGLLMLKDSLLFDGYTIENIRNYVKSNLANLPQAFELLDVKQKRTFIGLIFPQGFVWNYPGLEIRKS
jgi:DNA invertase Pin-like site-specific DNA recombinase